jgi:uracil-DNA glycosylase
MTGTWHNLLQAEREKAYFLYLLAFIANERAAGRKIYPTDDEIFNALNLTSFESTSVVILGQDPYHGEGQAHGLAFSVPEGVRLPPSLRNIFKELEQDLDLPKAVAGNLKNWAKQGVLLLNSVLTVEEGKAGSHANKGWEEFTDRIIAELATRKSNLVFMLWGSYAQRKAENIDPTKHLLLKAPHPSPLSAHRGFIGCKHFSQANHYLCEHGDAPIDWTI